MPDGTGYNLVNINSLVSLFSLLTGIRTVSLAFIRVESISSRSPFSKQADQSRLYPPPLPAQPGAISAEVVQEVKTLWPTLLKRREDAALHFHLSRWVQASDRFNDEDKLTRSLDLA